MPDMQAKSFEDQANQLTAAANEAEASFRRQYPLLWLFTLIAPFALTAALLAALYYYRGGDFLRQLTYTALVTFFLLGKFAILFGRDAPVDGELAFHEEMLHSLNRLEIFAMVLYMDLIVAVLLVFHAGFLFRLPWLGPKMTALVEDGQFILASNPWMKRAMFAGLVLFVMFPLAATGSIGGSIFGRLLGMKRFRVFCGVALGSVLGCGVMYFIGFAIRPIFENNIVRYSGIAIIVLLVIWMNYRYRRAKRRRMDLERKARELLIDE